MPPGSGVVQRTCTGAGCGAAFFLPGRMVFGCACWPVVSTIAFALPVICSQFAVTTLCGKLIDDELACTCVTTRRVWQPEARRTVAEAPTHRMPSPLAS